MAADNFISIDFSRDNLDRYYVRTSIFNALNTAKVTFKGKLLDVGCGKMPYRDFILKQSPVETYVGLDIDTALEYDTAVRPDFTWDGITMPFSAASFDTAFATEVLEHCPNPDRVLAEVKRVLKPGAAFFFTVPFLWPLHEVPHDEYRYTPFSLTRLLEEAGFKNITLQATGGWHASMAQMLGLWVKRAPMGKTPRKILSGILKPVISRLIKKDAGFKLQFKEGQMITGLSGIAYA